MYTASKTYPFRENCLLCDQKLIIPFDNDVKDAHAGLGYELVYKYVSD